MKGHLFMKDRNSSRDPLSKQISDKLEKIIRSGKYAVGERIPSENELMEKFNVSRNTIREAIRSLTWAGVLEARQGDGTYVCSTDRFSANMDKKYEEVSLSDIKEARNCIEVTVAHLAATRCLDEDREKITAAFLRRNADNSNIKEYTKADMDFHMAIACACHNIILIDLYKSISGYLENHITERNLDENLDFNEIEYQHEKLYNAVLEGQADKAAVAAKNILKL